MVTAISDDIFSPEIMSDPYTYFAQMREQDPVHWNERYQVWLVTRHDDLLWLTRHPELFSSQVFKNDPRPPYPPIDESDMGVYEHIREFFSKFMIQHDRPKHQQTRGVVHAYFNPKSQESWRPSSATKCLDVGVRRHHANSDPAWSLSSLEMDALSSGWPSRDPISRQQSDVIAGSRGAGDQLRDASASPCDRSPPGRTRCT